MASSANERLTANLRKDITYSKVCRINVAFTLIIVTPF